MHTQYQDLLPISDVILKDGRVSLVTCGNMCASDESCQTIFYKPSEGKCFLYSYSIWEYTPRKTENGIEIYEITSMDADSEFILNRAIGISVWSSWTGNATSFHAMASCEQRGGSLISLDTNQKIEFVTKYIRNSYQFSAKTRMTFQIGLNNTQGPGKYTWKWSNGDVFYNNLSLPFALNNFDGNMPNCSVGHCSVIHVGNSALGAYDRCCLDVAFYYVCSKDINVMAL